MTVNTSVDSDQIIEGDCLTELPKLPAGCANLIIADPPYNLDKNFGVWKEAEHRNEWLAWSQRWIRECVRLLAPGGSVFVYGSHHHLCWLQCYLYEQGLSYRRQIIWHYENGFAGYTKSLAAHYEPILWFSKGEEYFYLPIREPYKSHERLKYKVIKNGKVWQPNTDGRMMGDVWDIPTLAGRRFKDEKVAHPTQKPLALSLRIVQHFSRQGDSVLVPFAGSGTECLAAALSDRHYLGIELNPAYVVIAQDRIRRGLREGLQRELTAGRSP